MRVRARSIACKDIMIILYTVDRLLYNMEILEEAMMSQVVLHPRRAQESISITMYVENRNPKQNKNPSIGLAA